MHIKVFLFPNYIIIIIKKTLLSQDVKSKVCLSLETMNLSTKETLQPQELSEEEELGDVQIPLKTMKIFTPMGWPKNLLAKNKKSNIWRGYFEAHYGV